MSGRKITITLPEALYERVQEAATAVSLSFDEILAQSLALSLPALERDLPADVRSDVAALALLSNTALQRIADSVLDETQQLRLEDLAELQKQRPLFADEASDLTQLMAEAQRIMLRKAEARRLLVRRGQGVFDPPKPVSD